MAFALTATGIVIVALLGEVMLPRIGEAIERWKARRRVTPAGGDFDLDPGRERRAEARARLLLKSCVNDEEWAMYRDLGFIRVWGGQPDHAVGATTAEASDDAGGSDDAWASYDAWDDPADDPWPPHAYLVYPHKPVLAYVPQTGRLLSEHCVEFPDETRPYGSARLPDSDDVLAKWMALTGDEQRLLRTANMHLPGRQVDPRQVKRDLWRLRQWERERERARDDGTPAPDSRVPAS